VSVPIVIVPPVPVGAVRNMDPAVREALLRQVDHVLIGAAVAAVVVVLVFVAWHLWDH
jgi:hypothetical protein